MRRGARVVAVLGVAVVTAGGTWALARPSDSSPGATTASPSTATATVTRADLVDRENVDGTLGYAGTLHIGSRRQGTLTAVAAQGATITRGQPLFAIDTVPVVLLYGALPQWRQLHAGVADGPDVRQLEENLLAQGHARRRSLAVDDKWTAATTDAVKRWQKALGVEQTGTLDNGAVVFEPGAVRVTSAKLALGDAVAPGATVLDATSTTKVVTVQLDATKQHLVKQGAAATVRLPDGMTIAGRITRIGTAAVADSSQDGGSGTPKIPVELTLDDPAATGSLDAAPVTVGLTADSRQAVLTVPINALVALAEGGYGIEVVEFGRTQVVAVRAGLFADGRVEISGDGVHEGAAVRVPAS